MRKLTPLQKARAAECLGMAYSHLRVAQKLIRAEEYAASIGRLYYAAAFAARAACIELGKYSKKHSTWNGRFNKHFGKGQGWVPKTYTKLLIDLSNARDKVDYEGTLANDEKLARQWEFKVSLLLKKVRNNTPVYQYPAFIQQFFIDQLFFA